MIIYIYYLLNKNYKLKVTETKISTNIFKDFGKLFVEIKVLGFLIWAIVVGICTGMIWQYLFW